MASTNGQRGSVSAPRQGRLRAGLVLAALVVGAQAVAACGGDVSTSAAPTAASSTTASTSPTTAQPTPAATDGAATPSELAVAYLDAFQAQDWPRMRALAEPSSRYVIDNLSVAVSTPQPGSSSSGRGRLDLTVGSEEVRDDRAVVTFVGSLCPPAGATGACVTNSDPHTSNPQFRTSAVRIDGRWYVAFPHPTNGTLPPATGPAAPSAGTSSSPYAGSSSGAKAITTPPPARG